MSRMTWNAPERRFFETGLDRGVLYPKKTVPQGPILLKNLFPYPSFEAGTTTTVVETNLFPNPSAESAGGWSSNNGTSWTVSRDTVKKRSGTQSAKSVLNSGIGGGSIMSMYNIGAYGTTNPSVTAGTVVSGSAWFMTTATGYRCRIGIQFLDAASAIIGTTNYSAFVNLTPDIWARASAYNLTAPTGTSTVRMVADVVKITGNATSGDAAWIDDAFLTNSWGHGDYFDGSTPAGDEFTYDWTGTAHQSSSRRIAPAPTGVTGGAASAIQSSNWSSSGTKSLRVYSKFHSAGSAYIEFGSYVSWGKTYTMRLKYRVREQLASAPTLLANTLNNTPNVSFTVSGPSAAPGVYEMTLTFTMPVSGGGQKYVRFMNNNANGASVWVDDVILVEGDEIPEFFSGDTLDTGAATYEWLGTANASESIQREILTWAVPWDGLTSVEESGGEAAKAYYVDGRPFLFLPIPKEYKSTLNAYTYPDAFSEIMGLLEVTDGMYLDSQPGAAFDLSYRTLIGNAAQGADHGYKIHLVYNATVTPGGLNYETLSDSINPSTMSWEIQAVPVRVEGFRPTAHIVIDTRHMDPNKIAAIEELLYGSDNQVAGMPAPQLVFDILNYGDTIIVTDNGDGTFDVEGSYENVYMISEGEFRIDNVDGQDNGDGTFTISTTEG